MDNHHPAPRWSCQYRRPTDGVNKRVAAVRVDVAYMEAVQAS